ncbi:peptide/nickel transport system substrate-binding protein [Haloechinothrix alba]|uniref:Peptide/nickel transport system substrate-binding protein n=1 Tax=Haloechinothrix alba TaxID=664784 RepID=A0A239ACM8_9PSEU|nr:ABC transporter substrate-binding protein [Haloechinothrix alba]SNR93122.1 peptide/nickel transport system substrate-binding protein [Haloechinothrix alba]
MLQSRVTRLGRTALIGIVGALAVSLAGCESERDTGDGDRNETEPFVFGVPTDARTLDPIFTTDGETFRVTRQIYDTLLDHEPGGKEIVGGLAEDWESSDDGLEWTFQLREGVTFHDGEELDGEAVCANFDRWHNFEGAYQDTNFTYYWQNMFGGFAENEEGVDTEEKFRSCTADGLTVTIEVAEPSASYPGAFSMATFAILSPGSLEQIEDDEITSADSAFPDYTQGEGVLAGTGPYQISGWDHGSQEITLERFDDYWGDNAKVKTLIFKTISEETARRQALEAGDIHGYDLAAPGDVEPLKENGFQVPTRDVFNILYLAFQQETTPEFADLEVRQAMAHAVDRQRIVDTILPEGGEVASQFMPPTVDGWSEDVTTYDYDPELAEEMISDAGVDGLTVDFCYVTDTSRPYMPAVRDIFEIISSDLEEVGLSIDPKPMEWDQYIPATNSGQCSLYLLGWTGDFNEGYNFLGTWFDRPSDEWGFENDEIFDLMSEIDRTPDPEERAGKLAEANEVIMDFLPGLPISSSPPAIAFAPDVEPMDVSPLTQEVFADVSFAEE